MKKGLVFVPLLFYLISVIKSENKVILNHSNNRELLMLRCNISDDECCQNMKEVEFFKNGDGVCTVAKCTGGCAIPLSRMDTEYYRCGCIEDDLRNTYLHVTKYRESDNGNWMCGCYGKESGKKCISSLMLISKETFPKEVQIFNKKSTMSVTYQFYLIVCIAIILYVAIVLVIVFCVFRRIVSKQVIVKRSTWLTRLLIGLKQKTSEMEGNENSSTLANENKPLLVNQNHRKVDSEQMEKIQKIVTDLLYEKEQSWLLQYLVTEFLVSVNSAVNFSVSHYTTPKWCLCGYCKNMEKNYQPKCCRQCGVVEGCLSQSQNFRSKCLSKDALLEFYNSVQKDESIVGTAITLYLKDNHKITYEDCKSEVRDTKKTMRAFRAQAYNQCKVMMSAKMKFPLPSCCKIAIREVFPYPDG